MATKTLHNDVVLFAPIDLAKVSQQPDGTLLVPAVFSTERIDDQLERVTYEALKKAAPDYMEWAAVNEMHQPSAVGTTVELVLDDELRKASGTMHIVDPLAVQKVLTGVYRGTSIEGKKLHRSLSKAAGARWDVDDIQWNRISLADRPSNPDAVLLLAKAAGADEETDMDPEVPRENTAAAETVVADPPAGEQLAKTAADDLSWASGALTSISYILEHEAAEPTVEAGQLAALRAAQTALLSFMGQEAAEVGTPADVAESAAEVPETVVVEVSAMAYAEAIGDLRKATEEIRGLHASFSEALEKMTPIEGTTVLEAIESPDLSDDTLAKVAGAVADRLGTLAGKADVDAMKAELLEAVGPMKEQLTKIASIAAPGGPVRYLDRSGRSFGIGTGDEPEAESETDVLMKAAGMVSGTPLEATLRAEVAARQVGDIRKPR